MIVGLVALACYHATLLPGLDFGDTAAFQTGVGSINLTPRQAYPLYYGLGNLFAWLDPGEPAHAMNLASAVYGSLAALVLTLLTAELTDSITGGVAAGLFLAFSYTFWTQAIIAEVYTLHLLIVGLCLASLLAWSRKPALWRLARFYAIYAMGFGNHLSMVLLLPAFTLFILLYRERGHDDPLRPKAVAPALIVAALGALQYAWNFRGLWLADPPPSGLWNALGQFWFDVTKEDWRQTLVATVSAAGLRNRPAMYWFDLRQQFGLPGILLAVTGFAFIAARSRRVALLLFLCYLGNLIFAWNYNVGDVHVFFLPTHYIVALCAGAGVAAIGSMVANISSRSVAATTAAACLVYPLWRGYDTFPAVDRSWDARPTRVLEQFTAPPERQTSSSFPEAVFGIDANWQVQNGAEYYMRRHRPDVPWFTSDDLVWLNAPHAAGHAQHFVGANLDAGREVIVTPALAGKLELRPDSPADPLIGQLSALGPGTTYALGILRPYRDFPIDQSLLRAAWSELTGRTLELPPLRDYTIAVGVTGQRPALFETRDRPYRIHARVGDHEFDIRMESWLATDTIRRMGFGQVIVNRRPVLVLDRGISFATIGQLAPSPFIAYRSGIFAPLPRLRLGGSRGRP